MNSTFDAFLRSWPSEPWLVVGLALLASLYLRGWLQLHHRDPKRWPLRRLGSFHAGLIALFLALASPIETFSALLLQVHMVQHLLLIVAAPPLLWLGAPLFPLLCGLPEPIRTVWIAPLFRWRPLRTALGRITHPVSALVLFGAATWSWHLPALYDLALRDSRWHYVQHLCFLAAGLIFWYPLLLPYPARPRWSRWLLLPVLLAADVQNTALAALLAFSSQPLYPYYTEVPNLAGITPLADQAAAGAIMWVPGSIVFLVPLAVLSVQLLSGRPRPQRLEPLLVSGSRLALPLVARTPPGFDLLRVPVLGPFLKWRHARLAFQLPALVVCAVVIVDGLTGPQVGAMNLAGVLPWIHWRGLVVLGLLAAGNMFCMACPFMVPRTLARRWLPAQRPWPRWLRGKWLAVGMLALFLWAYEAFSLWDSPWWTAWLAIAYFVAALVVDGFFRGAAFCKYVCPIGQFHFVQSLMSPLEITVRDQAECRSCKTKDCIRGRDGIPGCELHLFQPRKAGNMDCTFCLDCVHACPHDNLAMPASMPGADLWRDPHRSGVGRFGQRPDLAALVVVLVFGAFANAAAMVGPVVGWQNRLGAALGLESHVATSTLFFAATLIGLPLALMAAAAVLSRDLAGGAGRWWEAATPFAFALVPLGFGMWLTHYTFHFLTGYETAVPALQRFLAECGWPFLGEPEWMCQCCLPVAGWLLRLEIVFLDLGLLLSLYSAWRIAQSRGNRPFLALLPWAALIVLLFLVGVWIVFQPMEMRGTMQS